MWIAGLSGNHRACGAADFVQCARSFDFAKKPSGGKAQRLFRGLDFRAFGVGGAGWGHNTGISVEIAAQVKARLLIKEGHMADDQSSQREALDTRRQLYFADLQLTEARHKGYAFNYESKAIDFANSTLRALTYLNGGALIAIPAAVGLFGVDANQIKDDLVYAAVAFVGGLLATVVAQAFAFFTMARRAEAEDQRSRDHYICMGIIHYPESMEADKSRLDQAADHRKRANDKGAASDKWRFAGLVAAGISALAFVIGCSLGVAAVLGS